jgi:hypothetical protein
MSDWFRAMGGQCGPRSITLPLRYDGPEELADLLVAASGEHVEDVGNEGMIFDGRVAELGDLAPGGDLVIMVRLDGTPGPQTVNLTLRASSGAGRWLVVESAGSGRPQITKQHPLD